MKILIKGPSVRELLQWVTWGLMASIQFYMLSVPNGWIVFSVNAKHYQTAGFSTKMTGLVTSISDFSTVEVPIYAPDATQAHAKDTALILAFRKS